MAKQRCSCYHVCMKTITLTEDAYGRLLEWKTSPRDSFSKVVLEVVPKRGTLGQMLDEVGRLPSLTKEQSVVMEDAAAWGSQPDKLRDKWNS